MKKSAIALYHGDEFQPQGTNRFLKDVIRVGKWIHPDTGQEVDVTPQRLRNLALNTERLRRNVDKNVLPFPDGHTVKAFDNLGDWPGPFFQLGDRIWGIVEARDEQVAGRIASKRIRSISPRIDFNYKDAHGNVYDEVITHVCATPYPVTDGQCDFVKLSREEESSLLLIPIELSGISPKGKEKHMDIKALVLALGLSEDVTDEAKILEAAKKAKDDLGKSATAAASLSALAAMLEKEHGLKYADGKVVKLSAPPPPDETPREREYRERCERLEKSASLSRFQSLKKEIEAACGNQIIPPSLVPAFTDLASIETEAQALCLSGDGTAVQKKAINALGRVMEIIHGLPKLNAQTLTQLSAAQLDEQQKIEKAAKDKAAEVLARTTGAEQK